VVATGSGLESPISPKDSYSTRAFYDYSRLPPRQTQNKPSGKPCGNFKPTERQVKLIRFKTMRDSEKTRRFTRCPGKYKNTSPPISMSTLKFVPSSLKIIITGKGVLKDIQNYVVGFRQRPRLFAQYRQKVRRYSTPRPRPTPSKGPRG
jgi:hypothetical protein